jgi:iron complex transport system permease protein
MSKGLKYSIILAIVCIMLTAANLLTGSVKIPAGDVWNILFGNNTKDIAWNYIIIQSRLPQTITAMLAGAALATTGLLLQTSFRNPLAGPSILGINSGAGLGVALVMLLLGGNLSIGTLQLGGCMAVIMGALIGAALITILILTLASKINNNVILLIVGLMTGYLVSAIVSLLSSWSSAEGVQSFLSWGYGNFGGVSLQQLPYFTAIIIVGLVGSLTLIKPLNALLLGENYATNLGVSVRKVRISLLSYTGLMAAVVTAFCGPISFLDLIVPHIARMVLHTSNHQSLMPVTMLTGAALSLFCNLICQLPATSGYIPLNVVTPIVGVPVVIYVLLHQNFK